MREALGSIPAPKKKRQKKKKPLLKICMHTTTFYIISQKGHMKNWEKLIASSVGWNGKSILLYILKF
jgi:hypothetical protein